MKYVVDVREEGHLEDFRETRLMSKSPRRKDLLSFLHPVLASCEVDERAIQEHLADAWSDLSFEERMGRTCCALAEAKAGHDPEVGQLVIAADTMVLFQGYVYHKPRDKEEARLMIRSYCGKEHTVVTGVCLLQKHFWKTFYAHAQVAFASATPYVRSQIEKYVESGKPFGKAGAYGIQELGLVS